MGYRLLGWAVWRFKLRRKVRMRLFLGGLIVAAIVATEYAQHRLAGGQ